MCIRHVWQQNITLQQNWMLCKEDRYNGIISRLSSPLYHICHCLPVPVWFLNCIFMTLSANLITPTRVWTMWMWDAKKKRRNNPDLTFKVFAGKCIKLQMVGYEKEIISEIYSVIFDLVQWATWKVNVTSHLFAFIPLSKKHFFFAVICSNFVLAYLWQLYEKSL